MLRKRLLMLAAVSTLASLSVRAQDDDLFLKDQPQYSSDVKNPDEQLVFAFELVRHGARAPIENRDLDKFTVAEG